MGINRRVKNSVCNLRYGPQTPLVRGIDNNNSNTNNKNDNDNDDDDDNNAVSLSPELAPAVNHKPTTLNNYTGQIARRKYARRLVKNHVFIQLVEFYWYANANA